MKGYEIIKDSTIQNNTVRLILWKTPWIIDESLASKGVIRDDDGVYRVVVYF